MDAGNRIVLIAAGNTVPEGQPGPDLQPLATGSDITHSRSASSDQSRTDNQ